MWTCTSQGNNDPNCSQWAGCRCVWLTSLSVWMCVWMVLIHKSQMIIAWLWLSVMLLFCKVWRGNDSKGRLVVASKGGLHPLSFFWYVNYFRILILIDGLVSFSKLSCSSHSPWSYVYVCPLPGRQTFTTLTPQPNVLQLSLIEITVQMYTIGN